METSSQTRILKDCTRTAKIARAQRLQSLGFLQSLSAGSAFIAINRRNCSNRTVGLDRHDRTSAHVDDARGSSETRPSWPANGIGANPGRTRHRTPNKDGRPRPKVARARDVLSSTSSKAPAIINAVLVATALMSTGKAAWRCESGSTQTRIVPAGALTWWHAVGRNSARNVVRRGSSLIRRRR